MNKIYVFIVLIFVFFGCNSQKVSVDFDRNEDFSSIKTFSIDHSVSTGLNDLDEARLFDALEKNFRFRGVLKSQHNGDVLISISPREFVTTSAGPSVGIGVGTGIMRSVGGGISMGVPIRSKSLNQEYTVSMYKQGRMIWEGIMTLKMPLNASADVKQQSMEAGVGKLLKNYPPKN